MSRRIGLAGALAAIVLMAMSGAIVSVSTDSAAAEPTGFTGPYSAVPLDIDSDSLYEFLRIDAGVHVNDTNGYVVVSRVFETMGSWMASASNLTPMRVPGDYSVGVDFCGGDLYDDGLNGTYFVVVELYLLSEFNTSVPFTTVAFTAGNFTYDQFIEQTHLEAMRDMPLDTESDGLYDYLAFDLSFHVVERPADYFLELSIDGIGTESKHLFMGDGTTNTSIAFEGAMIGNSGTNGPYLVHVALIGPFTYPNWELRLDYWTDNYTWNEFDNSGPPPPPPPASIVPPVTAMAIDSDSDSLYEALDVYVSVNAVQRGSFTLYGFVYTSSTMWTSRAQAVKTSTYELGSSSTVLTFDSADIYRSGLDGEYYVGLDLRDGSNVLISSLTWSLGNFSLSDFENPPPASFEEPFFDFGADTNHDGLYEYLGVVVQVNATTSGTFGISAWIVGLMTNSTGPLNMNANLVEGMNSVVIQFSSDLFAHADSDGPYSINLELMNATFTQAYESALYVTGNYTRGQFWTIPGAEFGTSSIDAPLDVNLDGAYEYLSVTVNITVNIPGTYNVTASISVFASPLDISWTLDYYSVGSWNVTFLFSGDAIKAQKWNGSYVVLMGLYNATGHLFKNAVHYTGYYSWVYFAKPPVAAAFAQELPDPTGLDYLLNASVSSVEAITYEVRWDFENDGIWDTDWLNTTTIAHEFPGSGNYTVAFEIRDVRGLTNRSTIIVAVTRTPQGHALLSTNMLPEVIIALAAILSVSIVLVLIAWPVESIVIAFLAFLVPLYSRLRSEDVLDNYRRGMIHGLILAHPGVSFSDMKETLSISSGSLVYHLNILQEKGLVCCRRSGPLMRYYVNGSPVSQLLKLGLTEFQIEIVKYLLSKGECSAQDIRASVKVSKQTLHYNLNKLVTDHVLMSTRFGVHRIYKVDTGFKRDISKALGGLETPGLQDGDRTSTKKEAPS